MSAVRPGKKVRTQQQVGCTEVISCSRHWPCLFPQHGPGRKHMRKIELQPWQRTIVTANVGRFARGLFHSDGYRGINRVRAQLAAGDHWYLAGWSMTVGMALLIASADSGLLSFSSSSAIAFTSLSLSWLPSRANSGT
jgi:hypothetical protein